jgi:molybdate transport system substrate-binding protein
MQTAGGEVRKLIRRPLVRRPLVRQPFLRIQPGWRNLVSVVAVIVLLAACAAQPAPSTSLTVMQSLTVMAAASLNAPFIEIGSLYERRNPGVKVQFSFAGSQELARQLADGAEASVFASANPEQMAAAVESGRVQPVTQQVFTANRLVVILPRDNPAGLQSLPDLAHPGVKIVLAAREVPVGRYSLAFLDLAGQDPALGDGYPQSVLQNVVSYENNVRAVFAKVSLGEADAGIVYETDLSGDSGAQVKRLEIPPALNVTAAYSIAPILNGPYPDHASGFIRLVLSTEGQAILARYGFLPIE